MDKPRIAHCRFYKGESLHDTLDKFDKVVTLAWNYDENTSVLTYAGTVYKKKNKRDHWIKRLHRDEALTRFFVAPVTIQLSNPSDILLTRIGLEELQEPRAKKGKRQGKARDRSRVGSQTESGGNRK